nr:hypothetical protein [uncultured Carboxylicivirga sp.]
MHKQTLSRSYQAIKQPVMDKMYGVFRVLHVTSKRNSVLNLWLNGLSLLSITIIHTVQYYSHLRKIEVSDILP